MVRLKLGMPKKMTPKSQAKIKLPFPRYPHLWGYIVIYNYAMYTLNYYEDKYLISLFTRFKHKAKIYNYGAYT